MFKILAIHIFFYILLASLTLFSCKDIENNEKNCPNFQIIPLSPYNEPIWHPSGKIIGFNHVPIKEIYYANGYNCPRQAIYTYEEDSLGFWLINSDGTNQHRVLGYYLNSPSWSPDGKWMLFEKNNQIYKMAFNGEVFDTMAIQQLTFSNRNFSPSWSPDGKWITYDSNEDSPSGLNFIWKMESNGLSKKRIVYTPNEGETRMPFWGKNNSIVHIRYIQGKAQSEIFEMDSAGGNVRRITINNDFDNLPKYSPISNEICFLSQSASSGDLSLVLFKKDGTTKSILSEVINFSWSTTFPWAEAHGY